MIKEQMEDRSEISPYIFLYSFAKQS